MYRIVLLLLIFMLFKNILRSQDKPLSDDYLSREVVAKWAASQVGEIYDSVKTSEEFAGAMLARIRGQEVKLKQDILKTYLVSSLQEQYDDRDKGLFYADSLIGEIPLQKNTPLRQSLLLGKCNMLSGLDRGEALKIPLQKLKELFDTGELDFFYSSHYFMFCSLLTETNNGAYSAKVLNYVSKKFSTDEYVFWRTQFQLALNACGVEDYAAAIIHIERVYPPNIDLLDSFALSQYYVVGSIAYLGNKQYEKAFIWANYSRAATPLTYAPPKGYYLTAMCEASQHLPSEDASKYCLDLLTYANDSNNINAFRRAAYETVLDYAGIQDWPIKTLSQLYSDWNNMNNKDAVLSNMQRISLSRIKNRINVLSTGNPTYISDLDTLIYLYEKRSSDDILKINNELATKYQTRIRQDSIANLTAGSKASKDIIQSRNRQLLLAGLLGVSFLFGFTFIRVLNARLRRKNNEIESHNNQLIDSKAEIEKQNIYISRLNHEINHRATNNLRNVKLLLKDQQKRARSTGLDNNAVKELERKILAFSKLQEKLNPNLIEVNLADYLKDFCEHLREAFSTDGKPVHFNHNIADINVSPDFAAPLALIINELATNSLKYARRNDGILNISLDAVMDEEDELRVYYRDGGPADGPISPEAFSSGQGMELVRDFTEQLEGHIIRYGEKADFYYEAVFDIAA